MKTVLIAFGTRPEAIKLAPLYREFRRRSDRLRLLCCITGQHRHILDPILEVFEIEPDFDLKLLKDNQTLFHITTGALEGTARILEENEIDLVIVQGDTTSAFAVALAAFYLKVPVGHVEAGLRSYDRFQPYPEEVNRTLISHVGDLHFCPTTRAADNLIREQLPADSVHVTGNTVIDALLYTVGVLEDGHEASRYVDDLDLPDGRTILVTGHRRENFGPGIRNLCNALVDIAKRHEDVNIVYSVHPNPNVRAPVEEILGAVARIKTIPPPDYFRFVALMKTAHLIVTDSGGIQEEAPSLKKPVLVARNVTERPEAVEAGAAKLVGTDRDLIVSEVHRLLTDTQYYQSMIIDRSPFGDGKASEKIADIVEDFFRNG